MPDGKVVYEVRVDDSKVDSDLDNANKKVESKSNKFAAAAEAAGVAIGGAFAKAGDTAVKFGADLDKSMDMLIENWDAVSVSLLKTWGAVKDYAVEIFTAIGDFLIKIFESIEEAVTNSVTATSEFFINTWDALKSTVIAIITSLSERFLSIFNGIEDNVSGTINAIKSIFGGLLDFITGIFAGDWEKAWNGIVKIFRGIFNLLPSAVESVVNSAISILNGLINGINKLTGVLHIAAIPTISLVSLPRFHAGGIVDFEAGEGFALLKDGEMVLTEPEQARMYSMLAGTAAAPQNSTSYGDQYITFEIKADDLTQMADVVRLFDDYVQTKRRGVS